MALINQAGPITPPHCGKGTQEVLRKKLTVLVAMMVAMMVVLSAGTAFARASDKASCQGQDLSFLATNLAPGQIGASFGSIASSNKDNTIGKLQSFRARNTPRGACFSS
jgi:hypothetical protein